MLPICVRPERVWPKLSSIQGIRANLVYIVSLALVPCIGPFTVWHFASELANYKTNELNLQKDFTIAYSGSDFSDEQKMLFFEKSTIRLSFYREERSKL